MLTVPKTDIEFAYDSEPIEITASGLMQKLAESNCVDPYEFIGQMIAHHGDGDSECDLIDWLVERQDVTDEHDREYLVELRDRLLKLVPLDAPK